MRVLGLDTTQSVCSAAVYDSDGDEVLARSHEQMERGHAERLPGMMRSTVAAAGLRFDQIDRIAVTTGPGTFTGVRIGLAMARGLGLALQKPVVGIGSLEVIAHNAGAIADGTHIAAVCDARRGCVYLQLFDAQCSALAAPMVLPIEDAVTRLAGQAVLLCGSGAHLLLTHLPDAIRTAIGPWPDAAIVAQLGAGLAEPEIPPRPLYLRPPDAKPQKQLVALEPQAADIKRADLEEAEALSGLHADCFADGWTEHDFKQLLQGPGVVALTALDQSGSQPLLGMILVRQAADEAEIVTLCTRPAARRRKIGRKLTDAAAGLLRRSGAKSLHLEVDVDNAAAIRLYETAGFVRSGLRKAYYKLPGGGRSDAVTMVLDLERFTP